MGVPAYLVASTLEAVLAQRLVRLTCRDCEGTGCATCRDSGYRGRTGIYELMLLDEEMRAEVQLQRGTSALRRAAQDRGMITLAEDGGRLILEGLTTPEEVARVTRA